jgi:glycosyltransferase involved in cell wall biosynthesis
VIPYHNAVDTVATTLRSILEDASSVSWHDKSEPWLQIVCVDNASSDASREAIESAWNEFAPKNFAFLTRTNEPQKGVSNARNQGLKSSIGEYIAFVDADDRVRPGYFNLLLTGKAYDVDVVSLAVSSPSQQRLAPNRYSVLSIEEYVDQFLNGWWCWSFVARRHLYDGLLFDGLCYEDVGLLPVMLSRAASILVTASIVYDYSKSSSSLTAQSAFWRAGQWDQQAERLRALSFSLLPVIRRRIDREYLKQRMLLRASAGMVPVLSFSQSWSYISVNRFNVDCLFRASLILQKNIVSAFRFIKRKFVSCPC